MRSHLFLIKVFFVVGAVWFYVIHPTRIPSAPKLGSTAAIERAVRFQFPEIKSESDDYTAKLAVEHRELSLRDVSSVGKASAHPTEEKSDKSSRAIQ